MKQKVCPVHNTWSSPLKNELMDCSCFSLRSDSSVRDSVGACATALNCKKEVEYLHFSSEVSPFQSAIQEQVPLDRTCKSIPILLHIL